MTARSWLALTLWVVVGAILAQAVLAGSGLFGSPRLFELHGWIGNGVLVVAAAAVVLGLVARGGPLLFFGNVVLTAGLISQIGMGYAGRRAGLTHISALHVPLGVALLGLAVALAVLATLPPRQQREDDATDASAASSADASTERSSGQA